MDIYENEDKNCVRHSWNVLPSSRIEAAKMVLPIGTLITPLKEVADLNVLGYNPVICNHCRGILNPYWYVCLSFVHSHVLFDLDEINTVCALKQ
ncbi:hypothetical protein D3C80_1850410 [compost metagenome]